MHIFETKIALDFHSMHYLSDVALKQYQYLRASISYNYSTSHKYNIIYTGLINSDDVEVL